MMTRRLPKWVLFIHAWITGTFGYGLLEYKGRTEQVVLWFFFIVNWLLGCYLVLLSGVEERDPHTGTVRAVRGTPGKTHLWHLLVSAFLEHSVLVAQRQEGSFPISPGLSSNRIDAVVRVNTQQFTIMLREELPAGGIKVIPVLVTVSGVDKVEQMGNYVLDA